MKTNPLILCGLAVVTLACQPDNDDQVKEAYLDLPETAYDYRFSDNDQLPTLGRVLFYDKQLSVNNSVSCSSCHKQTLAFADNVAFSRGFENTLTSRNSMPIQNLQPTGFVSLHLFWDGRENDLEKMVLKPIVNHVEMGIGDLDKLADKLEDVPFYRELFTRAYGNSEVTPDKISVALSSFLTNINSTDTRFDRSNHLNEPLNALELQGKTLFFEKYDCNSCHQVTDPNGYATQGGTFSNIGLDADYRDKGLEAVTGRPSDNGRFKIPSLRNVALTGPYMHDGRFNTLEEVIGHYSTDIEETPGLDFRLRGQNGAPVQFNISEQETRAIVAFLHTLTDHKLISDPKFSDPFKTR